MKSRIARVGYADPESLVAHDLNWRDHPQAQHEALETVFRELGWLKRVIVNAATGRIVDGHLRVQVALRHGIRSVPCVWVDLSEREEALILATLDPLAADAQADADKLRDLLVGLPDDLNRDLDELLRALAKQQGVSLAKPTPELSKAPEPIRCPRCAHSW